MSDSEHSDYEETEDSLQYKETEEIYCEKLMRLGFLNDAKDDYGYDIDFDRDEMMQLPIDEFIKRYNEYNQEIKYQHQIQEIKLGEHILNLLGINFETN